MGDKLNGIINTIGGIAKLSISLASIPLLIEYLGLKIYGEYVIITALINILSMAEWSIAIAVTVFLSKEISNTYKKNNNYQSVLSNIFIVVIAFSVLFFFLIYILVPFFNLINTGRQEMTLLLYDSLNIIVLIIFVRFFIQYFVGIEQAHKRYKATNIISTLNSLILSASIVISAWINADVLFILKVQLLISIIFVIIHLVWCLIEGLIWLDCFIYTNSIFTKEIIRFCAKTWTASFGGLLFLQGDKILIGNLFGLELTGIYSAITSIANQINQISSLPSQVIVPVISKRIVENNEYSKEANTETFFNAIDVNAFIAVLLVLIINMFSLEINHIIFSNKSIVENVNIKYMIIVASIYGIYSLNATGYFVLYSLNKVGYIAIITITSSILSLILIMIFSISLGFTGAFIGNIGFIITLLFLWKSANELQINIRNIFIRLVVPISCLILSFMIALCYLDILIRILFFVIFLIVIGLNLYYNFNKQLAVLNRKKLFL